MIYATLLLTGGFLRSLQFTAYNALAYADIPRNRMSAATSLYSTIQQLSQVLGISAGAAVLQISMLSQGDATPTLIDFSAAFIVVATISLLSAPLTLAMPRNSATEMSGHARGA